MANHIQQDLAQRVDAASARARELKAELEAANRRVRELLAAKSAKPAAPPPLFGPAAPARRPAPESRFRGRKAVVTGGLTALCLLLLAGGTLTLVQFTSSEPIPPSGAADAKDVTLEATAEPAAAPAEEETPALSQEEAAGSPTPGAAQDLVAAQELAAAQRQIERLSAEVETADLMMARLRDELALARQTGSGEAAATMATQPPQDDLAATVTSARVAELQRDLAAARQQIEALGMAAARAEQEAAKLRSALVDQDRLAAANAETASAAAPVAEPLLETEPTDTTPVIEEVLASAELEPESAEPEASAGPDTVSPDDLLRDPSPHVGQPVMVTGSVVWLLRRFWLQSESGDRTLQIDVGSLQPGVRNRLEAAVAKIDHLARVRARISGTVERQGSAAYRLAATDLIFIE